MARLAAIDDKTLIEYTDRYVALNPNIKIKYVDVEEFIKKQGVAINNGTIKKRKAVVEYIKSLNKKDQKTQESRIFAYTPLDLAGLSAVTHLTQQAKEILTNREVMIKQIVESAVAINEENKRLRDINRTLSSEIKAVKAQNEKLNSKEVTIASKDAEIKYYKEQLESICLPEVFNIIVNNLECSDIISKSKLEEKTLSATKPIEPFINNITGELMEGFDDETV